MAPFYGSYEEVWAPTTEGCTYAAVFYRQPPMTADPNPTELLHCNKCRHQMKHQLLKEVTNNHSEDWGDDFVFRHQIVHQLFECCGCSDVVLWQTYSDSEMDGNRSWNFPPRISRHQPNW